MLHSSFATSSMEEVSGKKGINPPLTPVLISPGVDVQVQLLRPQPPQLNHTTVTKLPDWETVIATCNTEDERSK